MMAVNTLKAKLDQGQSVIGIWSIIPSPIIAEIVGIAGLDFQILDMEHGVYDLPTIENSVRASEAVGCSALVRVAGSNLFSIQSCLDIGVSGIIVPQISNYESALTSVKYMKYYPAGSRGFNPFTRGGNYGIASVENSKLNNDYGLASIIIENIEAYNQLDQILTIPDLDMVYLGVYDMSVALGCKGDMNNPSLNEFVRTSVYKIQQMGKVAGLMVKSKDEIEMYLEMGARFLVYGVDTFVIQSKMIDIVDEFKSVAI
jgi:4-hydroxy-2-oxoheptanedioate aldolase